MYSLLLVLIVAQHHGVSLLSQYVRSPRSSAASACISLSLSSKSKTRAFSAMRLESRQVGKCIRDDYSPWTA